MACAAWSAEHLPHTKCMPNVSEVPSLEWPGSPLEGQMEVRLHWCDSWSKANILQGTLAERQCMQHAL